MRKIIFLDVDGVLNSLRCLEREDLGREHLILFKAIVQSTKCETVLSSTWRLVKDWRNSLELAFKEFKIPLWIDVTPEHKSVHDIVPRRNEIIDWLNKNTQERCNVVVLDDFDDADIKDHGLSHVKHLFIHTCMEQGLLLEHAEKAIDFLNYEI